MTLQKITFAASFALFAFGSIVLPSCQSKSNFGSYQGKPYADSVYTDGAQKIPGKLHCEYYDFGGEGIAYHDTDSINEGSGGLNPADGKYINSFRKIAKFTVIERKYGIGEVDWDNLYLCKDWDYKSDRMPIYKWFWQDR